MADSYDRGARWLERSGFTASSSVRPRWLTSMPGGQSLVEVSYVWGIGQKPWFARIGLVVGEGATPAAAIRRCAVNARSRAADIVATCDYIEGIKSGGEPPE